MLNIKEFRLEAFSNQYYQFIDEFAKTDYESEKLLGKFYTNHVVAEEMVRRAMKAIEPLQQGQQISVIDPFCGDGRLIIKVLQAFDQEYKILDIKLKITIWDIDEIALDKAKSAIEKYIVENDVNANIYAEKTDAFVAYYDVVNMFDICITNPPWGLLKPLKIFNTRCSDSEITEYKNFITAYDGYMKEEFSVSQPTSKFGRWGTNLGRCGLEVALKLISDRGVCAFVSPASLFNDQVSSAFRKWIFDNYSINSLSYFPAELKLYGSADVSSITAIIGHGITSKIQMRLYDSEFHFQENTFLENDIDLMERNDYSIPLESGLESMTLQVYLDSYITLEEYCTKHNLFFTRELDETRLKEKVCTDGRIVFAKGYMVNRYEFCSDGLFLNEEVIQPPKTVNFHKLVWRDVSRNSQKRRLKATLIQKNCIAGNSLGIIYSESDDICELRALLAIMNSYVFEFQARRKLVSNHVPVGVLKKIKVPDIFSDKTINSLVDERMIGIENEAMIETAVAKKYGLDYETFMNIAETFMLEKNEIEDLKKAWNV